ncbi:extracellular ligand-binding receptor [Thioploca ingrica]|uniref:Extracellular ligand-binding receptor n=1 Tax=Thioploca ingrica TaxID=40754 RepID=A0A090BVL6_9GAMM|nr:extracellular ligand-binding receptor [Thioploca ingrica]
MTTCVYSGLLWIVVGLLLLSACSSSPEEHTRERTNLAKIEDALAECRLLVLQDQFKQNSEDCKAFLNKDKECVSFPEQKEGCIQLIGASNYNARKMDCQKLRHQEGNCAKLVETEISSWFTEIPSWFYNAAKLVGLDWKKKSWIERIRAFVSEIHLGVIWSGYDRDISFLNGLKLAVEEINDQDGVLGRKLAIHIETSSMDLDKSREIAKRMRDNEKIRAVIGRQTSSLTIPFSYAYEKSNIVYLAVSATNNNVIRHGMRFIFRQLPNNDDFAKALVNFCVLKNYQNLSLLYSRDSYSEELSYAFRDYAIEHNLKIVFEKSFFQEQENFMDIAANMKELKLDAIFLATQSSTAVRVVEDLRGMGITAPLIGSDALDSDTFAQAVGEEGNGLVVPSIYNPFSKHPENIRFVKAYKNRYGHPPDTWAAQGYDAVRLLAYTMSKEVHSTIPVNITMGLRYMRPQIGATGMYAYENSGELVEKPIYFKELQHEEFILFKNTKQEEEQIQQTQQIEIVDDRIILRPEKPSESMEAISAF